MRIGYFDLNKGVGYPSSLKTYTYNSKQYCRSSVEGGCSSVYYDTLGKEIKEVCGMIEAYQYHSTDAFGFRQGATPTIDEPYLDGISITQGSPRQHIWSYVVASRAREFGGPCPTCSSAGNGGVSGPMFIGSDYYCATGNSGPGWEPKIYSNQLWDSPELLISCSANADPPWFKKRLTNSSTDNIEIRWCCDQVSVDEAIPTRRVELYIR